MYQRINGSTYRHIWVAGDLHGCFSQLMEALRHCKFNPWQDLLISVGDLIDRGPDSLKTLQLINEKWFFATRGNHEQMAMDALDDNQTALWSLNGGDWFNRASPLQQQQIYRLLAQCHQLPWVIEITTREALHVVAHADYPSSVYRFGQPLDAQKVIWDRHRLTEHLAGRHTAIGGADHFWFGHTPLRHRYDYDNQHYIDTGAVFSGVLTLVQIQ